MGWTRQGECSHCAWCCVATGQSIATVQLRPTSDVDYYRTRGFQVTHVGGKPVTATARVDMVLPCPLHDGQRCRDYANRPQTCRDFPQRPEQIEHTPCSYWFVDEHGNTRGGRNAPSHGRTV